MARRKVMFDESQDVEYKESWRDEYLKWVCGFAKAIRHEGGDKTGIWVTLE